MIMRLLIVALALSIPAGALAQAPAPDLFTS